MVVSLPYSDEALGHRATSPDVCVSASYKKATRDVFTLDEAIAIVQQEGLDIENDVDFDESDEGSIAPDPGETEFVRDDELGSESGDDDADAAPSEHSDEEEMQATEEDSEHGEEEMFAD